MRKLTIFIFLVIGFYPKCQTKIVGTYSFIRQELASSFRFSENYEFDFFYSYGAIDRNASGTYIIKSDTLFLKSDKEAGKDFSVLSQSKSGETYTIKFVDKNIYLLQGIRCSFFYDGGKRHDVVSDANGEVNLTLPKVERIYLMHTLFEDFATQIKDENNPNNNFKIGLNSSLGQVSFKGIKFKIIDNNTISCAPNYFIGLPETVFFKKEK